MPISSPAVPGPDGAPPRPDSGLTRSIITYPRSPGGRQGENLFPRNPLSSSRLTAIPSSGGLAEGSGNLQKAGAACPLWLQVLGLGPRLCPSTLLHDPSKPCPLSWPDKWSPALTLHHLIIPVTSSTWNHKDLDLVTFTYPLRASVSPSVKWGGGDNDNLLQWVVAWIQ